MASSLLLLPLLAVTVVLAMLHGGALVAGQPDICEDRLLPTCGSAWRSSSNKLGLFCEVDGNDTSSVLVQCNSCSPSSESAFQPHPDSRLHGVFVDWAQCLRGSSFPRLAPDLAPHTYCRVFLLADVDQNSTFSAIRAYFGDGEGYRLENSSCTVPNVSFFAGLAQLSGRASQTFARESATASTRESCVSATNLVDVNQQVIACTAGLEIDQRMVEGVENATLGRLKHRCDTCAANSVGNTTFDAGGVLMRIPFSAMTTFRLYQRIAGAGPANGVFYDGLSCQTLATQSREQYCPLLYFCANCTQMTAERFRPTAVVPDPTAAPSLASTTNRLARDGRWIVDQFRCYGLKHNVTSGGVEYAVVRSPTVPPRIGAYCQRLHEFDDRTHSAGFSQGLAADVLGAVDPPDSRAAGPVTPALPITLLALLATMFVMVILD